MWARERPPWARTRRAVIGSVCIPSVDAAARSSSTAYRTGVIPSSCRNRDQPKGDRVHFHATYANRAYCGAVSPGKVTRDRALITCPNCAAALRADEEVR